LQLCHAQRAERNSGRLNSEVQLKRTPTDAAGCSYAAASKDEDNTMKKLAVASAIILGGLSLSACATNYDDEFAALNSRVSAVEATANSALAAAQAAGADARNAHARIDALTTRVDVVEQRSTTVIRTPRN
jgi:outer membrane murein-binding lipoprotein Lpp